MATTAPEALVTTRASWHRVAEHVLAAGQYAATGTIRLRTVPGGFATTAGLGNRQLAVIGTELRVIRGESTAAQLLTTLAAAAGFAGVDLGLRSSYPPSTAADPDAPLPVDPAAARRLADWLVLGDAALRRFAAETGHPGEPVLWPEHFDVGITLEEVNYGCSPGDAEWPEPYLYVGPHEGRPALSSFWNASFGAAAGEFRIRDAAGGADFFAQGRAQVLENRSRT